MREINQHFILQITATEGQFPPFPIPNQSGTDMIKPHFWQQSECSIYSPEQVQSY